MKKIFTFIFLLISLSVFSQQNLVLKKLTVDSIHGRNKILWIKVDSLICFVFNNDTLCVDTFGGGGGSFDSFYVEQGTSTVQGWVGNKDTVTIDTTGLSAMTILTRMTKYSYQNTASGAITINCSNGYTHLLTTSGNITSWVLSNFPIGLPIRIRILYGGAHTVAAIGSVLWSGNTAPTYTATSGRTDWVTLIYDGTNYYGFFSPNHY